MAQKSGRRGGNVVTIHEVARHAGVSPMTVSRVVNGENNVRASTREKVEASIRTLRYSPNLAARSLASAETVRIGLLHSNPSAAYLSEFLVGSLEQSSLSGCQLVIEKCDEPGSERAAIEKLASTGADGLILPPPLCDSAESLQAVAKVGIPVVVVATGRPAEGLSAVSIDDYAAALSMTRHLISLGHRDIGFIKGHPNQTASERRYEGFLAGMAEAGLKVSRRQVAQGYFTYRSGLEAADLVEKQDHRGARHFGDRLHHRGQRRPDGRGQGRIVEADDRDVPWNIQALPVRHRDGGGGHVVVAGENRRGAGPGRQQRLRRLQS